MSLNPHSLSNQEVEVLKFLENDRFLVFLTSHSESSSIQLLKSFLYQKMSSGKTFMVRTSNKEKTLKYLKRWGLLDLTLSIQKDSHIQRSDVEKGFNSDRELQIEAMKSNIKYSTLISRLSEIQEIYNEPVFGEYARKKLSELLYLSNQRSLQYKLDLDISARNYLYNQKEFWNIRNKVEKASKHYKSSYNYLKTSDEFCGDIYKDFHTSENQEVVFKYLNKFLHDAQELSESYRAVFQSISEKLYNSYSQQVMLIRKLTDDLEIYLSFYEIEKELAPSQGLFKKGGGPLEASKTELRSRYQLLADTLRSSQIFKVNCPENSWNPEVTSLRKFCIDLKQLIKNSHHIVKSKVEEQIEILNANNFEAPELVELNVNQQMLIKAMNGSQIFKKEVHNLSISSWKNYSFLRSIVSKLQNSKLFLEANIDYAIYRSFEFSLDRKVYDIIEALKKVKPHLWMDSFEAWYFRALFDRYFIHDLVGIESQYDYLEEIKYVNKDFETYRLASTFQERKGQGNPLVKKIGKDGIAWKSLFLADSEGFKNNFPILLCDEDFFSSEIANLNYDYLICHDNKDIPLNIFANSHFQGILCQTTGVIDPEIKKSANAAKNYKKKQQFHLRSKAMSVDLDGDSALRKNLALGKYLTFVLKELSSEVQFYSAKDFSIITCTSEFSTRLMDMELFDHRIKSLKYTQLDSGIVDDIIIKEDKSKYLVIQDGFLDSKLDLEWQISVLRNLRLAGIKVLSLNTFELALDKKGAILNLLEIPELNVKYKQRMADEAKP